MADKVLTVDIVANTKQLDAIEKKISTPQKMHIELDKGSMTAFSYLQRMIDTINKQQINIKVDPSMATAFSTISEAMKGMNVENLQHLSDVLGKLEGETTVVNNLKELTATLIDLKTKMADTSDMSSSSFLGNVKDIVAQSDALKDLTKVLSASQAKIQEVSKAVGVTPGKDTKSSTSKKDESFGLWENKQQYKKDLSLYGSGMAAKARGQDVNKEQADAIKRVSMAYADARQNIQSADEAQRKFATSVVTAVDAKNTSNFLGITKKQNADLVKYSNPADVSKYSNIEGYSEKLQSLQSAVGTLNSLTIDWNDEKEVDDLNRLIQSIEMVKSELASMQSDYNKSLTQQASNSTKQVTDANKKAAESAKQASNATKRMYEGMTGDVQKELNETFSGKSFEKFGLFNDSKVKIDGSATLTFVKNLGNEIQTLQVKVNNANAAMNALKTGKFEEYVARAGDYQVTGTKKVPQPTEKAPPTALTKDQKTDIANYKSALRTQVQGGMLTSVESASLERVKQQYHEITQAAIEAGSAQDNFKRAVDTAGTEVLAQFQSKAESVYTKFSQNQDNLLPGGKEKVEELRVAVEQLNGMTIDWQDENQISQLQQQIELVNQLGSQLNSGQFTAASQASINSLMQRMSSVAMTNSKAFQSVEFGGDLRALQENINKMSFGKTSVADVKNYNAQLSGLVANFTNAQKAGASFGDIWKQRMTSMGAYLTTFASFYRIIQIVRQTMNTVKELDSAMIELEKVSDTTGARLTQSFENSKNTARDLGGTIDEVINATADWSRLGYNMDQSEELAKVALIYKHVGDGIDIDTANQSLISTLQGFKMDASEAMSIVDKFNEVANNMPIDSAGIGEALQRSAASFQASNTDLSESIALITGANAVVQDPSRVGNMWKTGFYCLIVQQCA